MKGSLFSPSHLHNHVSPSSTPPRDRHSFSDTMTEENIDYAESIIRKWDLDTHKHEKFSSLFVDDRQEAQRFVDAVTSLQSAMHYYVKLRSGSEKLIRAQNLMQMAIKRLEKEFYVVLSSNRKNLDSESISSRSSRASTRSSVSDFYEDEISVEEESTTSSRTSPPTPPRDDGDSVSESHKSSDTAMMDLKTIADCMINSGYAKECINIYRLIRKSIIDETLYSLGVGKPNHSLMQKMEWKVLEAKIKSWIHAVTVAVRTLFHGERILCDAVFSSSEKIAESCFTEISRDGAVNLFTFAQNFGKSKKILSPEKLFRALDMYEAVFDLWPEIESIFSHESLSVVISEAMAAMVKLGEAVRIMLTQFESAIRKDTSKAPIGGGVHPLTRYVMNFLVFVCDYSGAVSDIVADDSLVQSRSPLPESFFSSPISGGEDTTSAAITEKLAWLILVLLCKLDAKAVLYNNVALSYLFLANNLNYVVSKVRNSNLGLLIGHEWIWKNRSKVNEYLAKYERMGWGEVISSLPEDPTAEICLEEVNQSLTRFNLCFEETYKKQTSWVVPDSKLRDEVKISLAKKIIPVYRAFYQKHRGAGLEANIRYAPEDLDNYLSDLFLPVAAGGTRQGTSRGR